MVLQALEFSESLLDSPHFRENLSAHERELDNTSKLIKKLIKEGNDLIQAARKYAQCQKAFAETLLNFQFEVIGSQQTDDEKVIGQSFKNFGNLIIGIEEARDQMLENTKKTFVDRLEEYRKTQIQQAKDEKRKFEKTTKQYCTALEKHLTIKPAKVGEGHSQESDRSMETEKLTFNKQAMSYTMKLQEVQETKKFEFLETLLSFMLGWKTFYHQGYEVAEDMDVYMNQLSQKLQKTRENYSNTKDEMTTYMNKMLGSPIASKPTPDLPTPGYKMFTRQGYLFLQEKKTLGTIGWSKYFCSYQKDTKLFTMIPYNQQSTNATKQNLTPDTMVVTSCIRRATDSIDRRFCFDIDVKDRTSVYTLQALSDSDRLEWLEAMDGKDPVYAQPVICKDPQKYIIDDVGQTFVNKCIAAIESRGITDEGLYRIVGVSSKVQRLMSAALDPSKIDKLNLSDSESEYEVKTITSALKNYLKKLDEPLMTFKLHQKWITAAKNEEKSHRISEIAVLVRSLPEDNYRLLKTLIQHLVTVANECEKNLMGASNLSVCFGPTLLRPEEESMAAIMDIKFCNVVIEILIENYPSIFGGSSAPVNGSLTGSAPSNLPTPPPKHNKPKLNRFSEENTYGKLRTSYRANSVYQTPLGSLSPPQRPAHTPLVTLNNTNKQQESNTTGGTVTATSRASPSSSTGSELSHRSDLYPTRLNKNPTPPAVVTPQRNVHQRPPHTYTNTSVPGITNQMSQSYAGTTSQSFNQNSNPRPNSSLLARRVRTLYACDAENESELSFEPNQIIYDVKESREPGWLEGTLNGVTGLLPANYIEYM